MEQKTDGSHHKRQQFLSVECGRVWMGRRMTKTLQPQFHTTRNVSKDFDRTKIMKQRIMHYFCIALTCAAVLAQLPFDGLQGLPIGRADTLRIRERGLQVLI